MTLFLVVGGAPYGTEEIVPMAGPGMAMLVLVGMAIFWAAPYALIVSELVSAIALEGGIYQWFNAGLGPFWSFVFSYVDWVTWVLDSCLYPPLVAAYLLSPFTPAPSRWATWGVCLLIIWVLTWLNIRDVQIVGRISEALMALAAAPLVLIVVLGWSRFSLSSLSPLVHAGMPVTTALGHAMVWCVWSYSGYDSLANAGEEIVEPERYYPRVLAIALPLTVLGYTLPLMVALGVTPDWRHWGTGHYYFAALAVGGASLAACTALSAQFAGLGLFNGELLITSRIPYAMSRDGLLPALFARLHPRYQTPHVCLILQAVLYSVLTLLLSYTQLLLVSTWLAIPAYLLMFVTPIVLRLKRPDIRGRFRIRGGWPGLLLTVLSPTAIAIYVLFHIEPEHIRLGLCLGALGPLIYLALGPWRNRSGGNGGKTVENGESTL
jgi:APA family basic amino acid/polyamine antiporter